MTVPTEISRSGPYAGAGTTGPFTVGFRFLSNSHLQVIRTSTTGVDATLVLSTDYTVTGAGGTSGTVTLIVALAVGESLTIIRDVPFTQEADYVNGDSFPAESHEDALDLLTMQTQQLKDGLDRSLTLPATAVGVNTELPEAEALSLIGWNNSGDALQNYDAGSLGVAISTSSWYTELFDGTGVQTDFILGVDAGVASNCDVIVNNVPQVAGINFSYAPSTQTVSFLTGAPSAGTNNVVVRHGQALAAGTIGSTGITDGTVVGRSVLTAADAAAARTALAVTPANIGAAASGDNNDIAALLNASGIRVATRADVASAATVVLTSAPDDIQITGTTGITAFTVPVGRVLRVRFAASLTLTNNANIITQTGANITTQAGDTCILRSTAADTVEVLGYVAATANRKFVSSNQIVTGNSVLNIAHGLGVVPSDFKVVLRCISNDSGYLASDEVSADFLYANGVYVLQTASDATNVTIVLSGSNIQLLNKSTMAATNITLSNWRWVVRASA